MSIDAHRAAHRAYVAADLATAPPQRLRLMLVEAAIRFASDAREHALASRWAIAGEAFVQARRALIELREGIRPAPQVGDNPAAAGLAEKVRALYAFLFRLLTEAQLYRDPRRLDDALRLLALERETWLHFCNQTAEAALLRPEDPGVEALPSLSFQA